MQLKAVSAAPENLTRHRTAGITELQPMGTTVGDSHSIRTLKWQLKSCLVVFFFSQLSFRQVNLQLGLSACLVLLRPSTLSYILCRHEQSVFRRARRWLMANGAILNRQWRIPPLLWSVLPVSWDVQLVHFCSTRLMKLQGLAVVSKTLINPKDKRAWADEGGVCAVFCWSFVAVALPPDENLFMC